MNIPEKKFRKFVLRAAADIVAELPPDLQSKAAELIFTVAELPSAEQASMAHDGVESDDNLLGLYEGVSLIHRTTETLPLLPDRITLFRVPFMELCKNEQELHNEIRLTILHELGHFFGLDERALEKRGLS